MPISPGDGARPGQRQKGLQVGGVDAAKILADARIGGNARAALMRPYCPKPRSALVREIISRVGPNRRDDCLQLWAADSHENAFMADPTIIDGLFVELMTAAKPYMSAAETVDVQNLLDEAQYELALETVVDAFVEGGKSATAEVFSIITRLTNMLQLPLDSSIQKIDRL